MQQREIPREPHCLPQQCLSQEIWYARFSVCRTRGCSLLVERTRASARGELLDDPQAMEPASGQARGAVAGPSASILYILYIFHEFLDIVHIANIA